MTTAIKTFTTHQGETIQFTLDPITFKTPDMEDFEDIISKSELFRRMYDAGMEISEIRTATNSHYSFVYSVVSESRELRAVSKVTKSQKIIQLHVAGEKPRTIAKVLDAHPSFVYGVISKYKKQQVQEEDPVQEEPIKQTQMDSDSEEDLSSKKVVELRKIASQLKLKNYGKMKKPQLIEQIQQARQN